jgi:hypothetical protein
MHSSGGSRDKVHGKGLGDRFEAQRLATHGGSGDPLIGEKLVNLLKRLSSIRRLDLVPSLELLL